ncbi:hypothetical protein [Patulibacter minatonensis]|uniref:hypothetical protein n=1 Tax=Patulibacter minatonensis TaxID=298163 RepID=UPI00047D555E|nr:hypothetical protein [Patulibacter minatonensis]
MNRGLYGNATVVLSSIVALIGVAIVVRTVAGGGGPVAQGILIGALFMIAGGGRAWMAWRGATLAQPRGGADAGSRGAGEGRADD